VALAKAIEPDGHVTATDTSPLSLKAASERARRLGLSNLTFREATPHELPFPDGAFDRVTCRCRAKTFVDIQRALGESYRVLKPGGRAIFATSLQRDSLVNKVPTGPSSLAEAMRLAGFSEIQDEADGFVIGTRPWITVGIQMTRNDSGCHPSNISTSTHITKRRHDDAESTQTYRHNTHVLAEPCGDATNVDDCRPRHRSA
jgi:SAM-dependent methyltransferase